MKANCAYKRRVRWQRRSDQTRSFPALGTVFRPIVRGRRTMRQLILLGALPLIACHTWREQPGQSPFIAMGYPTRIRVILVSGERLTLDSARVAGDSLYGFRRGRAQSGAEAVVRLPLKDVARVERREFSNSRSIGLGVGVTFAAALAAAAWVFVALATWDWSGE